MYLAGCCRRRKIRRCGVQKCGSCARRAAGRRCLGAAAGPALGRLPGSAVDAWRAGVDGGIAEDSTLVVRLSAMGFGNFRLFLAHGAGLVRRGLRHRTTTTTQHFNCYPHPQGLGHDLRNPAYRTSLAIFLA